ncbi:hypothetical protein GCM10007901_35760 [Dyella acidisoli]|uniref:Uncharacterized protein n=1 Tax=Dyella acidisoli TaxID=1867834 RepID=A0ABQ5XWC8_9GAMM|nr:hypothetical protein GCM10007901_35760 [Dyella acidisoli]
MGYWDNSLGQHAAANLLQRDLVQVCIVFWLAFAPWRMLDWGNLWSPSARGWLCSSFEVSEIPSNVNQAPRFGASGLQA